MKDKKIATGVLGLILIAGVASAGHGFFDDYYCTAQNPDGDTCYYDPVDHYCENQCDPYVKDSCDPEYGERQAYDNKDSNPKNCNDYCKDDTTVQHRSNSCGSNGWECQNGDFGSGDKYEYKETTDCSKKNSCTTTSEKCEDYDGDGRADDKVKRGDRDIYTCSNGGCKKSGTETDSSECRSVQYDHEDCVKDCTCTEWKNKGCGGHDGDFDGDNCKDTEMSQRKECTDNFGDYCGSGVSWRCVERTQCGGDKNETGGSGSSSGSGITGECNSDSDCGGGTSCSYSSQCDEVADKKVARCNNPSTNSSTCTTTTTTSGCPTRNTDPTADYSYSQDAENIDYDGSSSSSNAGPSIYSYSWSHGDGSSSSGQTVTHEYGTRGNYDTTLTVSNACGSDSETKYYVWIDSRGTEMDKTQISSPSNRWGLDKNTGSSEKCVYEGSLKSESTTIDIGKNNKDLEKGGHSLDEEACVSDSNSGPGGRWWDKDTEEAIDEIGGGEVNYYEGAWGGRTMPAVEEADTGIGNQTPIWAPYIEGQRDDDYDQSGNEPGDGKSSKTNVEWNFWGIHNRVQDQSDQMETGPDKYSSEPHPDKINRWAITPNLKQSVDNTGEPYPPGNCYPRDQDSRLRTDVGDNSVNKSDKAFANSYAGLISGDGTWKNPDDLTKDQLRFGCDIGGSDLGIGHDIGGPDSMDDSGLGKTYTADIRFDELGYSNPDMEQPVCGDDEDEHLVGELGESQKGTWEGGQIYCTPESLKNQCITDENGNLNFEPRGNVQQRNEPGESSGRLKTDQEVCGKHSKGLSMWLDQDYRADLCQKNILYGNDGVRWFTADYINKHPEAVTGGIDDSWNQPLQTDNQLSLISAPGLGEYNSTHSPVATGTDYSKVAVPSSNSFEYGFCGGEDESEYLVTQECSSQYCDTDRTVIGVKKNPDACIFDENSTRYETDADERKLYNPGESVSITEVQGNPKISCFDGTWYSEFPINFRNSNVTVQLGNFRTTSFDIVNPRDRTTTFEVTMEDPGESPSAYQFADLQSAEGTSFTTTVGPESSQTHQVRFYGGNTKLDKSDDASELYIRADAVNSETFGSDYTTVDIVNETVDQGQGTRQVPGIQEIHILALLTAATLIFLKLG